MRYSNSRRSRPISTVLALVALLLSILIGSAAGHASASEGTLGVVGDNDATAPQLSGELTRAMEQINAALPVAYGYAPPNPDLYPIWVQNYYGGSNLARCIKGGDAGVAGGIYADYYCWMEAPAITSLWVRPA